MFHDPAKKGLVVQYKNIMSESIGIVIGVHALDEKKKLLIRQKKFKMIGFTFSLFKLSTIKKFNIKS